MVNSPQSHKLFSRISIAGSHTSENKKPNRVKYNQIAKNEFIWKTNVFNKLITNRPNRQIYIKWKESEKEHLCEPNYTYGTLLGIFWMGCHITNNIYCIRIKTTLNGWFIFIVRPSFNFLKKICETRDETKENYTMSKWTKNYNIWSLWWSFQKKNFNWIKALEKPSSLRIH